MEASSGPGWPAHGALLERERELLAISTALATARAGTGSLLLIEAGAGLGKSSLLGFAQRRGAAGGLLVLRARGEEHERPLPFGGALQLFEGLLRRSAAQERAAMLSGSAGLAGELFDGPARLRRLPDEAQAASIIHGLFWLTANLGELAETGGPRPVALLVDDAHLLDDVSLSFLAYLARRLEDLPVALIVALRPHEPSPSARLAALRGEHARLLSPKALSVAAVERLLHAELASGSVAPEFARAAARVSGGNPFLVRALIDELCAEGIEPDARHADRISEIAPDSVLRAVVARLTRLPAPAEAIAKAVALLGDGAAIELACELAGVEPGVAGGALDGLAAEGLFEPGEPLRFSHPLIASAIRSDLAEAWRADMELRAARLLAARGEPPERIATHLLGAARSGDPWVVDVLERAAIHGRACGAPAIAVAHLKRALSEPPAPGRRAGLLIALAEAEAAAGLPDAVGHLQDALALVEDPLTRAELMGRLGRQLAAGGRHDDAAEAFKRAVELVGDSRSRLARELRAGMIISVLAGERVLRALSAVEHLGRSPAGARLPAEREALTVAAIQAVFAGRPVAEFRPLILRAIEGSDRFLDPTRDAGLMLTPAAVTLLYADELELELELLEDALSRARRVGSLPALAAVSYLRTWPLYFSGAIAAAIADAEQALSARPHGWSMWTGAAHAILAHAQIERGDLDDARATLDQVDPPDERERSWAMGMLLVARGRLRLVERDPAGALQDVVTAARLAEEQGVSGRPITWRSVAALATFALGDRKRAIALAGEERERAEQIGAARTVGMALRVCGIVEGGRRGLASLRAATEALESSPSKLELARALVDLGSLMRRTGARTGSREPLRRGLDMAQRFGALPLALRARDELRASGARPRRVALSGLDALTPSEQRIATLAADGLTNREIAQHLFVTTKSVEYHLRHVFHKLDIGSRKQLPPLIRGDDLGPRSPAERPTDGPPGAPRRSGTR